MSSTIITVALLGAGGYIAYQVYTKSKSHPPPAPKYTTTHPPSVSAGLFPNLLIPGLDATIAKIGEGIEKITAFQLVGNPDPHDYADKKLGQWYDYKIDKWVW